MVAEGPRRPSSRPERPGSRLHPPACRRRETQTLHTSETVSTCCLALILPACLASQLRCPKPAKFATLDRCPSPPNPPLSPSSLQSSPRHAQTIFSRMSFTFTERAGFTMKKQEDWQKKLVEAGRAPVNTPVPSGFCQLAAARCRKCCCARCDECRIRNCEHALLAPEARDPSP